MNFGIYGIIYKPVLNYVTVAEVFAEEDVRILQFREKHLKDREIIELATRLKQVLKDSKTLLIINDRADIARIVGADGVHLGQDDIPVSAARFIVGQNALIGLSTHNLEQLTKAHEHKPDYVGFGPIYPTTTKQNPDPVVGTDMLQRAVIQSSIPIVAIGGIFPENLDEVLKTGVKNICMVRFFMESKSKIELRERIQFVKRKLKEYDPDAKSPSG